MSLMIYIMLYMLLLMYYLLLEVAMRKYYFLGYSLIVLFKGAFNRRNTNAAFGTVFEDGIRNSLFCVIQIIIWIITREFINVKRAKNNYIFLIYRLIHKNTQPSEARLGTVLIRHMFLIIEFS